MENSILGEKPWPTRKKSTMRKIVIITQNNSPQCKLQEHSLKTFILLAFNFNLKLDNTKENLKINTPNL